MDFKAYKLRNCVVELEHKTYHIIDGYTSSFVKGSIMNFYVDTTELSNSLKLDSVQYLL